MFDLFPVFARLNPRLAAFLVVLLLVAAAIPIALAWWRLLPPEREPFDRPDVPRKKSKRNYLLVFLLSNLSLSFVVAIPRINETFHLQGLVSWFSSPWQDRVSLVFAIWCVLSPALTAAFAAVRHNPIRSHLVLAGILVLALWLLSPTLLSSLASLP